MSESENIVEFENQPKPMNVYQMVSEVTKRLCERGGIGKDQTNEYDKYKFRGIDQVYDALAPILSGVGLNIFPKVTSRAVEIRQAKSGGSLNFVTLDVEYKLVSNQDGSSETVTVSGEAMDRSDKATNKALSAAFKYMCFQVFCIPLEGQDSESESPELGKNTSRAEPVARTVANEIQMDPKILSESIASVRMACFNEDKAGMYEIYDELANNDERAKVFGSLDQEERKLCRAWLKERAEEAQE